MLTLTAINNLIIEIGGVGNGVVFINNRDFKNDGKNNFKGKASIDKQRT